MKKRKKGKKLILKEHCKKIFYIFFIVKNANFPFNEQAEMVDNILYFDFVKTFAKIVQSSFTETQKAYFLSLNIRTYMYTKKNNFVKLAWTVS